MRVPIPNDWQGDFECFRVYWPNSLRWHAILRGLITTPLRGRYWDERTGDIKSVQEVAWQIYERNLILENCRVCADNPDRDNCSSCVEGCDDMGQVVTDITFENGVLTKWFGPCCPVAVTGELVVDPDTVIPSDPFQNGAENPASDCGAANGVMDVLNGVVEACFSALNELPWQYLSSVEHFVGYNLKDKYVFLTIGAAALVVDGFGKSYQDVFDPIDDTIIRNRLSEYFSVNGIAVPDDNAFSAIRSIILGEMGLDITRGAIWAPALDSIGRSLLDKIVKSGAYETSGDCSAPAIGGLVDVTANWLDVDWKWWFDWTKQDLPSWAFFSSGAGATWVPGTGMVKPITGAGLWRVKIEYPFNPEAGVITRLYMLYEVMSGFDYEGGAGYNDIHTDVSVLDKLGYPGWSDTDPAQGGLVSVNMTGLAHTVIGTDNKLVSDISGQDTVQDGSHKIIMKAFAIGGTGTDPFSGH